MNANDYTKVKVVGITQPLNVAKTVKSADDLIAYIARVSNPSNQANTDTAEKLIGYLIKNNHWSPFEMVTMQFEIETTRDIARQMLRHRSISFQEFSQRYADPTKSMEFITREARLQDPKNRQNSIENDDIDLDIQWELSQSEVIKLATETYEWAIRNGIAKEQARAVFPEGLTMSRLYASASVRSIIHYHQVRSKSWGAQKEHFILSDKLWEQFKIYMPKTAGAVELVQKS